MNVSHMYTFLGHTWYIDRQMCHAQKSITIVTFERLYCDLFNQFPSFKNYKQCILIYNFLSYF